MTSQPGLQTFAIQIFPNISQSKGNQKMKFGQLIEYNKRNIFLQKFEINLIFLIKSFWYMTKKSR